MLAGHDSAAQVDCRYPVERLLCELVERLVAAGDADPDVVVQNVASWGTARLSARWQDKDASAGSRA